MVARLNTEIDHTGYSYLDSVSATSRLVRSDLGSLGNSTAAALLQMVRDASHVTIGELAMRLEAAYGIPQSRALTEVANFVSSSQAAGLFSFHSSALRNFRYGWLRPLENIAFSPWVHRGAAMSLRRRRYAEATFWNTLRISGFRQGMLGFILSVFMSATTIVVGGVFALEGDFGVLAMAGLLISSIVVAATAGVAHETSHLLASRALRCVVTGVYYDRMIVGLQRKRSTRPGEAMITIAGPLAGALVSAVWFIVALVYLLASSYDSYLGEFGGMLILGPSGLFLIYHLSSLLPPSADGRALIAALCPKTNRLVEV